MKIYAVNSGQYSDYGINALFSSRQKALEYMRTFSSSWPRYNEIEEYELDPRDAAFAQRGYECWVVRMLKSGDVEKVFTVDGTPDGFYIWRRTKAPAYRNKNIPDALNFQCWAKNAEHAIKSCNEKRIELIASGEWGAE